MLSDILIDFKKSKSYSESNINLNLIYKNIGNTNLNKSYLNEVSTDTVFAFSTKAARQKWKIIAVNF